MEQQGPVTFQNEQFSAIVNCLPYYVSESGLILNNKRQRLVISFAGNKARHRYVCIKKKK